MTEVERMVRKLQQREAKRLASPWTLGFADRGMGRGDYAILEQKTAMVIPCPDRVLVEHIIGLHNKAIGKKP